MSKSVSIRCEHSINFSLLYHSNFFLFYSDFRKKDSILSAHFKTSKKLNKTFCTSLSDNTRILIRFNVIRFLSERNKLCYFSDFGNLREKISIKPFN